MYLVIFLLALIKETLMVFGSLVLLKQRIVVYADWIGKIATGMFAVGVVLSLVFFIAPEVEPANIYILMASTALSYAALIHYAVRSFSGKNGKPRAPEQ